MRNMWFSLVAPSPLSERTDLIAVSGPCSGATRVATEGAVRSRPL
jgi:hypothetical protein